MSFQIGVDSGGTFTDSVLITPDGEVSVGKALSTPDRPATGVLDSIQAAAIQIGVSLEDALAGCAMFAHGTTVGLNTLLTRRGARVGLLTTVGFEDVAFIARMNKAVGIDAERFTDPRAWSKPTPIAERDCIIGIRERVDRNGDVLVDLDEDDVRSSLGRLTENRVEAIAVAYLWSFLEPRHERRTRELIEEVLPGVHVTLSSDLAPRLGEYERTTTSLLNCYVAPRVEVYLTDLAEQIESRGFAGTFLVSKSSGGVQTAATITRRAIDTLRSGPVGGLSAAMSVGRHLGHENIIASDVGGTSFDVGLIVDGRAQHAPRPMIDRYSIALPIVDVESIGTGGGSIAWLDSDSGGLRVGPQSAGASPGPACYRRGGDLPTVTDAAVALGYLDQLGGTLDLDREAARRAIEAFIAAPLGMTVEQAAQGVLDISNAQMADLVRRVTVLRGYDPRDFVLYAFGGAAPQYAGRYGADLGVGELVIPVFAPVFSAYGAITSDLRTSAELEAPLAYPPPLPWITETLNALEQRARAELSDVSTELKVERWASLRFRRQVHQIDVAIPLGEIDANTLVEIARSFEAEYERSFGAGTAYVEAGIELSAIRVEVVAPADVPLPKRIGADRTSPIGSRQAWFDGDFGTCPVFDGPTTASGLAIVGPAFVSHATTELVVYPGQIATIDDMGNTRLEVTT